MIWWNFSNLEVKWASMMHPIPLQRDGNESWKDLVRQELMSFSLVSRTGPHNVPFHEEGKEGWEKDGKALCYQPLEWYFIVNDSFLLTFPPYSLTESICDRPDIVEQNIRAVKISHPDYVSWNKEEALKDFQRRINNHLPYYEPLSEKHLSWVKMINVGERMIVNNVNGFLPVSPCE